MSSATTIPEPHEAPGPHTGRGNGHNPHLAHHFDTPEQQIASGKLGMWVFLATEILMFGGLFCAYSIYRHNYYDVFEIAHRMLNKQLGAINTLVLITSSLTMAWGVRQAQLGRQGGLIFCLALTIIGGYVFMGIKAEEYKAKFEHGVGFSRANDYRPLPTDLTKPEVRPGGGTPAVPEIKPEGEQAGHDAAKAEGPAHAVPANPAAPEHSAPANPAALADAAAASGTPAHPEGPAAAAAGTVKKPAAGVNPDYSDPNAGTGDAAVHPPLVVGPAGMAPKAVEEMKKHEFTPEVLAEEYKTLPELSQERMFTFFQIYFLMTGLHGIHVLVGMALIFWILVRACPPHARKAVNLLGLASFGAFLIYLGLLVGSRWTWAAGAVLIGLAIVGGPLISALRAKRTVPVGTTGEFGPDYFAPVDIIGLYWHLVDIIWIFLFPLLYLIH